MAFITLIFHAAKMHIFRQIGTPMVEMMARIKPLAENRLKSFQKQGLSAQGEPIICKKLLFLHRCGTEQPARFQADIHFAVRICHGRVFLTGTTGGGCRQWNDDGREATMLDSVYFCKRKKQSSNCNHSDFLHHIGKR
ncbi:MAG: hypothetical protein II001_03230 [Bacteroidales bacterium]|nr:hypothetical protein [Bacteroidales bacterium]